MFIKIESHESSLKEKFLGYSPRHFRRVKKDLGVETKDVEGSRTLIVKSEIR